jgi:hypothetical protein
MKNYWKNMKIFRNVRYLFAAITSLQQANNIPQTIKLLSDKLVITSQQPSFALITNKNYLQKCSTTNNTHL